MKASYITTCLNTMTPDLGYDSYTDEELVILVQTGYPSAKIVLCHRYVPLITKYSHVSQLQTIQSELEATLWECFLEAIQTYDTTGTVPFSGFVKSRIHYCEMNLFRRMRTQWTHEATCIQNEEGGRSSIRASRSEQHRRGSVGSFAASSINRGSFPNRPYLC